MQIFCDLCCFYRAVTKYKFNAFTPAKALRNVVKSFFTIEFSAAQYSSDYLLPDGLPSLLYVHADKPVKVYFGKGKQPVLLQNGFYAGYSNTLVEFTHTGFTIVGVSVYPVYVSMLFGISPHDIVNRFKKLDNPAKLSAVPALINKSSRSDEKIIELFEKHLTERLNIHPLKDDLIRMYKKLTSPGGYHLRVEELAKKLGYSTRNLNLQFKQHVGMSPKKFIKLVKFNHALKYMYSLKAEQNLATIAYEVGYHDQSHFIRDFKSICGKTPKEILTAPGSLANKFILF